MIYLYRSLKSICKLFLLLLILLLGNSSLYSAPRAGTEPEVLSVVNETKGSFDVCEALLSNRVHLWIKKQSDHYLVLRLIPALKPVTFDVWRAMRKPFSRFMINQHDEFTELIMSCKDVLCVPYVDAVSDGKFKLSLPIVRRPLPGGSKIKSVSDGIEYFLYKKKVAMGAKNCNVHVLKAKPSAYAGLICPALACEGLAKKETMSSMVKRYKAVCGINAGFFSAKGEPLGTLIINRKLVSSPIYNRSVFGLTDDNRAVVGNPEFSGVLRSGEIVLDIDGVNQPRKKGDRIIVYTPEYAAHTMSTEPGTELILIKGKVVGIQDMNAYIPPDGIVIAAGGDNADKLRNIRLGSSVDITYAVNPPWNTIKHAVSGGPRLVLDGETDINSEEEHFGVGIADGRHPRTAIGVAYDSSIVLIVADGRSKNSSGMTLSELASFMKEIGVRNGINLDGGGSSTMVIKNKVVNNPSDKSERAVSNGILLFTRQ